MGARDSKAKAPGLQKITTSNEVKSEKEMKSTKTTSFEIKYNKEEPTQLRPTSGMSLLKPTQVREVVTGNV